MLLVFCRATEPAPYAGLTHPRQPANQTEEALLPANHTEKRNIVLPTNKITGQAWNQPIKLKDIQKCQPITLRGTMAVCLSLLYMLHCLQPGTDGMQLIGERKSRTYRILKWFACVGNCDDEKQKAMNGLLVIGH